MRSPLFKGRALRIAPLLAVALALQAAACVGAGYRDDAPASVLTAYARAAHPTFARPNSLIASGATAESVTRLG